MDKEFENTILDYLRGFKAKLDSMSANLDQITASIGRIETHVAEMRQEVDEMAGHSSASSIGSTASGRFKAAVQEHCKGVSEARTPSAGGDRLRGSKSPT